MKTLKSGASEEDKVKFLQEAAIMGQLSHINVIKIHGVVTLGEPVSVMFLMHLKLLCFCIHSVFDQGGGTVLLESIALLSKIRMALGNCAPCHDNRCA